MQRLRDVDGMAARCLEFVVLTACRSGEARLATWTEIDIRTKTWSIPGSRMKSGRAHSVPLSNEVVALLKALPRLEGTEYVFPGARAGKPLSDMALTTTMRRMEVDAVPHGFRASFSSWCASSTAYPMEVREMALAHAIGNDTVAAYQRSDLFDKRRRPDGGLGEIPEHEASQARQRYRNQLGDMMIDDKEGKRRFFADVENVPDHLLQDWTARIQTGERNNEVHGLAQAVIHDFCLRQDLGHGQSEVTLRWLVDVLEGILDHRDPMEVLGLLPRPKSRPPDPQRAIDVAWWLRTAELQGYLPQEAVALAADCFDRDAKTIERYRKQGAGWTEGMNPDIGHWERYFLSSKPPRPLPPPRDKK